MRRVRRGRAPGIGITPPRIARPACLAVALVVGVSAFGAAPASAQSTIWPSSNGLLVYRSDRDGNPDLFTLAPTTSANESLAGAPGAEESQPAWSPEGGRIAFIRRTGPTRRPDLFVMSSTGGGRMRLTSSAMPERDPSWSPEGTLIVYAAPTSVNGDVHLFLVRADGRGRRQLTSQAAGSADRAPVFSPDGRRIAFVSDRAGGFPELYVMDADGSNVRRLTNNGEIDGNPSWSSDGTRLVFERCCANGNSDILTIDVATRTETNLTNSSTRQDFDPSWSPDGTRIAYVSFERGVGNVDVWVMNADGSSPARLTNAPAPDLSPDWQPVPTCTVSGTDQADDLTGTHGNDVICALDGDDQVSTLAGDDLVLGDRGGDAVKGDEGSDLLFGERGNDVLAGGSEYDVIDGGPGIDTCTPGADGAFRRLCEP